MGVKVGEITPTRENGIGNLRHLKFSGPDNTMCTFNAADGAITVTKTTGMATETFPITRRVLLRVSRRMWITISWSSRSQNRSPSPAYLSLVNSDGFTHDSEHRRVRVGRLNPRAAAPQMNADTEMMKKP